MFVSKTHLPQILSSENYTSQAIMDREVDEILTPCWHCLSTLSNLPKEGSYVTIEFLKRPLLIWRSGTAAQAYLNVCPNCSSLVTDKETGCAPGKIACQHCQCEIRQSAPSNGSNGDSHVALTPVKSAMLGQVVMVTFNDDAPPLSTFFGSLWKDIEFAFTDKYTLVWEMTLVHESNWKIPMENTVETYHTSVVHPTTFGDYPEEQWCTHEFYDQWDQLRVDYTYKGKKNRGEALVCKLLGIDPVYTFRHIVHHPNIVISLQRLFNTIWVVVPDSPGTCREIIWTFCDLSTARGLKGKIAEKLLRMWVKWFSDTVRIEDAAIFPCVQKGHEADIHPTHAGLISTREERIFSFQRYIHEKLYPGQPTTTRELPPGFCAVGGEMQTADSAR